MQFLDVGSPTELDLASLLVGHRADHTPWHAAHEGARRDFAPGGHQRPGRDEAACADDGVVHDGCAHPDQAVVFDVAAVQDGSMAHRDAGPDHRLGKVGGVVADRAILKVGVRANPNGAHVPAQHGRGPHRHALLEGDVADHDGGGVNPTTRMEMRRVAAEILDHGTIPCGEDSSAVMLTTLLVVFTAPSWASDRLDPVVEPLSQRVVLMGLDPAVEAYTGRVEIALQVPHKLDTFELHAEGLQVHRASLVRERSSKPMAAEVAAVDGNRIRVTSHRRLKPGTWTLTLEFDGTVQDQAFGLYRFEHAGEPYLVTQLEADEARTAWPCFDEPTFKIPWQLQVEHPEGLTIVSNTPGRTSHTDAGASTTFGWTKPLPSYAVALALGPYVGTKVEGMTPPSTIYTVAGNAHLAQSVAVELPAVTRYLETWFDAPFPYEKLDVIAAPEFAFGGMENPGAVVLHEALLMHPERPNAQRRHQLLLVTAHEVAHMWFGNQVTLEWWDDLWLNESFATWVGEDTRRQLAPDYRGEVMRVSTLEGALRADGRTTTRPVRVQIDPNAVFETSNFAAYTKGEALLDMTRAWIGPDAFQLGLKRYLQRHAWGNATQTDLFAALEEASRRPVGEVLAAFLDQPGAPTVHVARNDDGTFEVSQRRYAVLGAEVEPTVWQIPMAFRVGTAGWQHGRGASDLAQGTPNFGSGRGDLAASGRRRVWLLRLVGGRRHRRGAGGRLRSADGAGAAVMVGRPSPPGRLRRGRG